MLNIFGRKYEISEITEIYTGRPPPGSRNQFFNCELLHGCILVAGRNNVTCWLPGYMLVTGFLITVYLINGHRFVVSPLVDGCGLLAGVGMMQHAAIVFC